MKYLLTFAAPALIALCIIGLVSAQAPPAAPTGVTVFPSGEGILISWASNDAVSHWVAWMNKSEYQAARDTGDWTTALNYAYVPSGDTHVIPVESLIKDDDYWFIAGSAGSQNPSAVSWGAWQSATALHGLSKREALTRAYVMQGIEYYETNGLDAALAHYGSPRSIEGERGMMIVRVSDHTLLASAMFPQLVGNNAMFSPRAPLGHILSNATAAGYWAEAFAVDPASGQEVPILAFAVKRDGLVFTAFHTIIREDLAGIAVDYVQKAIELYDREGLDATVAYYDSRDSVDDQFYLFLIDENDIYLAHPIFPHLKGTDIKNVVGSDGQELGKEIAQATEAGHWVDYLWPNPVTGHEGPKSAWVIRHDGLIFASGYYTPDPNAEPPAWKDAEPREYTVAYVEKAIARYERDGLEAMKQYYNSVASFEGQWYMFIMDANDLYIVHGLLPHLIGTDVKTVQSEDNPDLGKEIAAATEEGIWVEYLWPHPITLQDAPKVAYAARHDGLIFASGYYYPKVTDPRSYTQEYVTDAIAYYDKNGWEATVAYYGSSESFDGQWYLILGDANDVVVTSAVNPKRIGAAVWFPATEEGQWSQRQFSDPGTPGSDWIHRWAVRHDGLIFSSAYFTTE